MSILTETAHPTNVIVSEAPGTLSREKITIDESQTVRAGECLGRVTASGEYARYDNGAGDGTEVARAIALADVTTGAGETADIAALVRLCEVNKSEVLFDAGQNQAAQDAAFVDLEAAFVIARPTA